MITQVYGLRPVLDAARKKNEIRVGYMHIRGDKKYGQGLIAIQAKNGECEILSFLIEHLGGSTKGSNKTNRLIDVLRQKGYTVIVGITGILELTQAGFTRPFSVDEVIAFFEEEA